MPEGHRGDIVHPAPTDQGWVEIKHLVAAGLLPPGTTLLPRPGQWDSRRALVRPDGLLEVDGKTFDSPSGAGKYVKGAVTNGWAFWRLEDGRRLADVRAIYRGDEPSRDVSKKSFDWAPLHGILEALPDGHWTTYGDLADAIGTSPQPLGNHITSCPQCVNAHKVLTSGGRVAEAFSWGDLEDHRDPAAMLYEEGIRFVAGRADSGKRISVQDIRRLAGSEENV